VHWDRGTRLQFANQLAAKLTVPGRFRERFSLRRLQLSDTGQTLGARRNYQSRSSSATLGVMPISGTDNSVMSISADRIKYLIDCRLPGTGFYVRRIRRVTGFV